ncbi:MAG TPA: hypothetical protein VK901_07210 [Nitrospiraceae bacterium]|nr:hypothetical protein [Nitrospiraceae bacterium]
MTRKAAFARTGAMVWGGILLGMSGCISVDALPTSSTYWEAKDVPSSQVITDYNACKVWSTVKYAESEKREELITDGLGYWIHVPLLKACMEHKGYTYVGPESGSRLHTQSSRS